MSEEPRRLGEINKLASWLADAFAEAGIEGVAWRQSDLVQLVADAKELIGRCHAAEGEAERLRGAILEHQGRRGDDRCWLDDEELYDAVGLEPVTALPPKCEFLSSCERFWEQRQRPEEKTAEPSGMTIAQLQAGFVRLTVERNRLLAAATAVIPYTATLHGKFADPAAVSRLADVIAELEREGG